MENALFHLAFPSHDLAAARRFYVQGLGCKVGRSSPHSLILNLAGHQVVAQKVDEPLPLQKGIYPRHFGLVLKDKGQWEGLLRRAQEARLDFYIEPQLRHQAKPTEYHRFFLKDPSNNLLEFKYYTHDSAIFGESSGSNADPIGENA